MAEWTIKFLEKTVIKAGEPSLMRIEAEKARRAYEIGRASGLFSVPRLLDFDPSTGAITFERLHGMKDIERILAYRSNAREYIRTISMSLAVIHKELVLPDEIVCPIVPELRMPGESQVFLHGDFGFYNVLLGREGGIVILDWQMTPQYGREGTYGTRYFDLMWFVYSIFDRPVHKFPFSASATSQAQLFLRTYFEVSDYPYDYEECREYMLRLFELRVARKRKASTWKGRLVRALPQAKLMAFANSFRLK